MKVSVIGHGHVGRQMAMMMNNGFEVVAYDIDRDQVFDEHTYPVTHDREEAQGADLAIICVPTPSLPDGGCDTSIVEEVCRWVDAPLVVIKSTVPPGFTEKLGSDRFHFSPEYSGEPVNYVPPQYPSPWSSLMHDFCIVGGPQASLVLDFFARVMATSAKYVACTSTEAELCKYMENAYFATKVMFCTEFYLMCRAAGVDYKAVRALWLLDSRVDPDHTMVFPDALGFGGKCLPKDLSAIITWARKSGHTPVLLSAVRAMNGAVRLAEMEEAAE